MQTFPSSQRLGSILTTPPSHSTWAPLTPPHLSQFVISRKPKSSLCSASPLAAAWLLVSLSPGATYLLTPATLLATSSSFLRWGQWSSVGCKLGGGANNQEQEPCLVQRGHVRKWVCVNTSLGEFTDKPEIQFNNMSLSSLLWGSEPSACIFLTYLWTFLLRKWALYVGTNAWADKNRVEKYVLKDKLRLDQVTMRNWTEMVSDCYVMRNYIKYTNIFSL